LDWGGAREQKTALMGVGGSRKIRCKAAFTRQTNVGQLVFPFLGGFWF